MAIGEIPEDGEQISFILPEGVMSGLQKDMTIGQFRKLPGGLQNYMADFVVNGRFEVHYDTAINAAGTAQTVNGSIDLFKTGIGQTGIVWNSAATFVKTNFHTDVGAEGTFPFQVAGIVTGAEILYIPYPAKAATVGSSSTIGQVTDVADNASQPTGYNPTGLLRAMLLQNRWEWHWGEVDLSENGQWWELPCSFALSGFAAGGNNNLSQNAGFMSKVRGLSKAKVIRRTELGWFIRSISQSALAQPVDMVAQFLLRTIEIGEHRKD